MADIKMTDEEKLALDYSYKVEPFMDVGIDNGISVYCRQDVEQAYLDGYLAGLKAGRLKWHKVADGYLPKHCRYGTRTSEYVLAKFKFGNTGVCYFDFDLLGWFVDGYSEQLKNIIAWCEIPKYTEEQIMFEKEAKLYKLDFLTKELLPRKTAEEVWQDGAEFGYNKAMQEWRDCFMSCSSPYCADKFKDVRCSGMLGNMTKEITNGKE